MTKKEIIKVDKPKPRYDDSYLETGHKLALLGMNDKDIAFVLCNGDEDLLQDWYLTYPLFTREVIRGRALADAEVAQALFLRATGQIVEEVQRRYADNEKGERKLIGIREYKRYVLPDVKAIELWLKTRQRELWPQDLRTQGPKDASGKPIDTEDDLAQAFMDRIRGRRARLKDDGRADTEDDPELE